MIKRLTQKNSPDIINLLQRFEDRYQDFYITKNKDRIFLNNNFGLIQKILNKQECYGDESNGIIKGIIIIYREKGFRTFLKIYGDRNSIYRLLKYLSWNCNQKELWVKVKKENPINNTLQKFNRRKIETSYVFSFGGLRGEEILLRGSKKRIIRPQKNFGEKKDEQN